MANEIGKQETSSFIFVILDSNEEMKMKNIPHSTLPNLYGLLKYYPSTLIFEFDVQCNSYDYISNA